MLAGNNEDYLDPDTRMWFVPGEDGRHGCMFFGYADGFPQGGMNDAGLFFDGLALEPEPIEPKPDAEPVVRETARHGLDGHVGVASDAVPPTSMMRAGAGAAHTSAASSAPTATMSV